MPFYDIVCPNEHKEVDIFKKMSDPYPACKECGEQTVQLFGTRRSITTDDIPGGIWIEHGICNEDGTPKKYYSKSEMAREAKRRGLVSMVRHVGDKGSDKNKHTTRWV